MHRYKYTKDNAANHLKWVNSRRDIPLVEQQTYPKRVYEHPRRP